MTGAKGMKKKRKSFLCIITIGLLGLFVLPLTGNAANENSNSAACIACHTDLEAMDSFGADAAKGGAGIAG